MAMALERENMVYESGAVEELELSSAPLRGKSAILPH